MPQISAVIITRNEEENIARALESLSGIIGDVLVIDSGSTDETVEICRRYGARVFERTWKGYSPAKNFGNLQTENPWILSIDADEALSDQLKASVLEKISEEWPENKVFSMNRITNYRGKWIRHSGWYPDTKIRIWHRDFGRWEGDIHEVLIFKGQPDKIHLKGDLLHYSFPKRQDYLAQRDHFATLSANSMFTKGKKVGPVRLWLSPVVRFIRDYLINLGFLDGKAGLEVCCGTAVGVFKKYKRLRRLHSTAHR